MLKKILIPLMLVAMLLALVGCGDTSTPESSATPAPSASTSATAGTTPDTNTTPGPNDTPGTNGGSATDQIDDLIAAAKYMKPGDNYRIFYYYIAQEGDLDYVYPTTATARDQMTNELGHKIMDATGITLTFMTHQNTWFTTYCTSAASGTPIADMMYAGGPHTLVTNYMWNGQAGSALQSLDAYKHVYDFSNDEFWDTQAQNTMCTFSNELYFFVPRLVGESMVNLNQFTFYNVDLLDNAGYSLEELANNAKEGNWTWDYFKQVATAVNSPDEDVYALCSAQENSLAYNLMASNGGDYIKQVEIDGEMVDRFAAHEPESIAAWDFYLELSNANLIRPNSIGPEIEISLFTSGKVAMALTYLNRADKFYTTMADQDFALLPIPKAPNAENYVSTQNWFMPYCLFKNIPNPEGVVEFCSLFYLPPYAKNSAENNLLMDAELSLRLRDSYSIQFAKDALTYSYVSKMMTYQMTTTQYMWDNTPKFISGELSPAIYFDSVKTVVNTEIDKYRESK